MKYAVFLLLLLLLPLVNAIPEPSLLQTIDLDSEMPNIRANANNVFERTDGYIAYPTDDIVAVLVANASHAMLVAYEMDSGIQIYKDIWDCQACAYNPTMDYYQGMLLVDSPRLAPGGGTRELRLYDFRAPYFVQLQSQILYTDFTAQQPQIIITDVNTAFQEVQYFRILSGSKSHYELNWVNDTSLVQSTQTGITNLVNVSTVDRVNRIITAGRTFYRYYEDEDTNFTTLATIPAPNGNIELFNGDATSPAYLTVNGYLVYPNDYLSPQISGIAASTFDSYVFFDENQIYGELASSGQLSGLNFTSPVNPIGEIYTTTLLSRKANNKPSGSPTSSGLFVTYESVLNDQIQVFGVDLLQAIISAQNNLPGLTAEFLGTDSSEENFVFLLGIGDVDGGVVYSAIDVDVPGAFSLEDSSDSELYEFLTQSELSIVEVEPGTIASYNVTFSGPIPSFNIDGSFRFNNTNYPEPVYFDTDDYYSSIYDEIDVEANLVYIPNAGIISYPYARSWDYLDASDVMLSQVIFNHINNTAVNVTYWDGLNEQPIGILEPYTDGVDFYSVESTIYFTNSTINHRIYKNAGSLVGSVTISFLNPQSSFGKIGSTYAIESGLGDVLYVDKLEILFTQSGQTPSYTFYRNLNAGETYFKDVRVPIPDGFGDYEANVFATDSTLGLDAYNVTEQLLFTYSSTTPSLTDAEITDLVSQSQTSASPVFEEGDFITDTLGTFLDSIGLTTTYSKMFAGFLILLLVVGFMSGYPVEAQLLVDTIAFLLLTLWGFFPAWLLVIVIVLCVGLVAMAARKVFTGG